LIVRDVSPTLALSPQKLGIETPGNYGIENDIVLIVGTVPIQQACNMGVSPFEVSPGDLSEFRVG